MTATDYSGLKRHEHPLDIVERLASIHDRTFDRPGDDEITLTVQGNWGLYHVAFNWLESMEALHIACAFDLKVLDRWRSSWCPLRSSSRCAPGNWPRAMLPEQIGRAHV